MRLRKASLVAIATLVAFGAVQTLLTAQELAAQPPTTRPRLPLSALLWLMTLAAGLVAYAWLGHAIARAGGSAAGAAGAGSFVGLVSGGIQAVMQAVVLLPYLRLILASYGVPEASASLLIGGALVVATFIGAAFGAVVTLLAALLSAPLLRAVKYVRLRPW